MSPGKDNGANGQAGLRWLRAPAAFVGGAMQADVAIGIAVDGTIGAVRRAGEEGFPERAEEAGGAVVPGVPNLHSHSFQRGMAGLAQVAGPGGDSFWSWRTTMYRFLGRLGPDEVEAIALQLQIECLLHGFTSLAEFHYLHLDPEGRPYADLAELALRQVAAAERSGIALTLLPVLYRQGGFGAVPPTEGQRRFVLDADRFGALVARLASLCEEAGFGLGVAPHSLRAVTPGQLRDAVAIADSIGPSAPIHIHAAEQVLEVEQCLAWSGRRPVEWLLDEAGVDARWTLIHATHLTEAETARLAASGAVAGLCPSTEADLGDGLFPLAAYRRAGGRLGVGTDSHVVRGAAEELRLLDWGARLSGRIRNVASVPEGRSIGASLFEASLAGGAQAMGRKAGRIAPGFAADLVVLDLEHPALAGRSGDAIVDSWLFTGSGNPVRHVMVGGRWRVRDGVHEAAEAAGARFVALQRRLAAS